MSLHVYGPVLATALLFFGFYALVKLVTQIFGEQPTPQDAAKARRLAEHQARYRAISASAERERCIQAVYSACSRSSRPDGD